MEHTNGGTRRHGMTVARGGIVVAKRLDVESLPLPAVSYELRSEREERTEVTLVEQLPATVDSDQVGYHPEYGGDGWSAYDDGELVWRGELGPEESRRVVLAVWLDSPDTAVSLLTPPTVESVRTVARDTEPQVLDETLLTSTGHATGASAVAERVPEGALRSTDVDAPTLADLPTPGDGLDAPPRGVVDEAADAIVGGGSDREYERYYHLRIAVESADRGHRDVSVLEDLTNALAVLFADADDRDGGAWRVLDVAIGTNWQAERIVTALGDDCRVSGLVVTELTGAVAAQAAASEAPDADPNPDEFAASVFESATTSPDEESAAAGDVSAVDEVVAPPEPEATGGSAEPAGRTGSPSDGDGGFGDGLDEETTFDFGEGATADDDPGLDDEQSGAFEFGNGGEDEGVDVPVDDRGPVEQTDPSSVTDGEDTAESDDAMATFAELKAETERADVAELDDELAGMVLSPTGSEEYSIESLLDTVEDDTGFSSV